jgi:hypothetical protein
MRMIWQTRGLIMKSTPDPTPATPTTTRTTATDVPQGTPDAAGCPRPPALPREIGGREGPEPTRFGDWEKAGRCIDF